VIVGVGCLNLTGFWSLSLTIAKENRERFVRHQSLLNFYIHNCDEVEARWRSRGGSGWLWEQSVRIVTGFAYSVLLDSDGERRFALDAVLAGKGVDRDSDGRLVVVEPDLDRVVVDGEVLDLSGLPDGFFAGGDSTLPFISER
jgi:hypothetical protein